MSFTQQLRPLYLITDGGPLRQAGRLLNALVEVLSEFGEKIAALQLREQVLGSKYPPASDEELKEIISALAPLCADTGTGLVVNRNTELAKVKGVTGIHIGAPLSEIRRLGDFFGSEFTIGYSAHGIEEAEEAFLQGVDYLLLAPIFPPISKISSCPALGIEKLAALCSRQEKPVYALGGITPANTSLVRQAGASGVACIGSVWSASQPVEAVWQLLEGWGR